MDKDLLDKLKEFVELAKPLSPFYAITDYGTVLLMFIKADGTSTAYSVGNVDDIQWCTNSMNAYIKEVKDNPENNTFWSRQVTVR